MLVSYLHVVFGEMVPKNLSFSVPDRAVLLLAPPLVFLARVFRPIIVALNATANGVLRLFGVEPKSEATSTFTLEEVQTIVDQSRREGVLDDASGTLTAAFEFTTKQVKDVAVPMSGLVSLPPTATPGDVERAVARHGFSRYVILDADGEPDGYVHLKDVIDLDDDEFDDPMPAEAHPPARLDLRRHRPRGRPRDDAPPRHARRARVRRGRHHDRRDLPRGHHRGARRRGAGRDPARVSHEHGIDPTAHLGSA